MQIQGCDTSLGQDDAVGAGPGAAGLGARRAVPHVEAAADGPDGLVLHPQAVVQLVDGKSRVGNFIMLAGCGCDEALNRNVALREGQAANDPDFNFQARILGCFLSPVPKKFAAPFHGGGEGASSVGGKKVRKKPVTRTGWVRAPLGLFLDDILDVVGGDDAPDVTRHPGRMATNRVRLIMASVPVLEQFAADADRRAAVQRHNYTHGDMALPLEDAMFAAVEANVHGADEGGAPSAPVPVPFPPPAPAPAPVMPI